MRVEANKDYTFNEDQYLFKYLDLHKLIYFLNSENLFFSPLSYFDDPLEGISKKVLFDKHEVDIKKEAYENSDDRILQDDEKKEHYRNYLEKVQQQLFASCWFLGIRESLAMWETYSNNDSVALRFNPNHLCDIMIKRFKEIEEKDFDVMVHGKVEYFKLSPFDPDDASLKNCGHKFTGFLKDLSYKHEEEFRFLLIQKNQRQHSEYYEFELGLLKDLDFTIITHPYMEEWKFKNIYNILKNNGLDDKLVKSAILTRKQIFDTP
jgi:hypothetical protein